MTESPPALARGRSSSKLPEFDAPSRRSPSMPPSSTDSPARLDRRPASFHGGQDVLEAAPSPDAAGGSNEDVSMLFDMICNDYFTARYASSESGIHILEASLVKLLKVIMLPEKNVSVKMATRIARFCEDIANESIAKEAEIRSHKAAPADMDIDLHVESLLREWIKPKLLLLVEEMRLERALRGSAGHGPSQDVASLGEIRIEGYLRKKGQHVNIWRERYFMIRSAPNGTHILCYFRKKGDREPRGWYALGPGCTVDEVRESPSLIESKRLFTIRIRHYSSTYSEESEEFTDTMPMTPLATPGTTSGEGFDFDFDPKANVKKARLKKLAAAATAATAVVLTGGLAGIGLVGVGAAAVSSAALTASASTLLTKNSVAAVSLAAESLETALWWRNSILECVAQAEAHWRQYVHWYLAQDRDVDADVVAPTSPVLSPQASKTPKVAPPPKITRRPSLGAVPRSMLKQLRWLNGLDRWSLYKQNSNLLVYANPVATERWPPMKASLAISAPPQRVFDMLMQMDSPFYKSNCLLKRAYVLEATNTHTDIVYWKLNPVALWPVVVEARDYCLLRYWYQEPDGSYVVWFHSVPHADCPPNSHPEERVVRGTMLGSGFIIAPPRADDGHGCFVSLVVHANPHGWLESRVGVNFAYVQAYQVELLNLLVVLKTSFYAHEYVSMKRKFSAPAPFEPLLPEDNTPLLAPYVDVSPLSYPLADMYWAEPEAVNFSVRGPQYPIDKVKLPSETQIFRLLGVEAYSSNQKKMHAFGLKSLRTVAEKQFYFIVNFIFPGPPYYSLVLYFTPEEPHFLVPKAPWTELLADFFDGDDSAFRSNRLKLIPRVLEGNWAVREGVGNTPTILGNKVTQRYSRGSNFCEIDYDIASSTVASGLCRLLLGYSQDLVIDLGFVLEGAMMEELPERLLGCVRLRNLDLPLTAVPYPF
ncbi:hypothetical protein ACHHYP_16187 [Achlya hypogyna]|uniref:START domain-containing protein n=1 Tax=Achlya hypogyna TaxID=1202772 RepID=A0A1V9Y9E4_ACHHY|nr:hypothetical protein ACHHYP_16187 [Achlya hypogyna]